MYFWGIYRENKIWDFTRNVLPQSSGNFHPEADPELKKAPNPDSELIRSSERLRIPIRSWNLIDPEKN